jgi:hypothetical protein
LNIFPIILRRWWIHRIILVRQFWEILYIYTYIGWFKMIVAKYGNYVRKFMWQLCEWDRVVIFMIFHKRPFDFFDIITHWFDSFQNCATMNCQRNINSTLPTQLPHTFSYIVAILGHNHFESPNIQDVPELAPQRKKGALGRIY